MSTVDKNKPVAPKLDLNKDLLAEIGNKIKADQAKQIAEAEKAPQDVSEGYKATEARARDALLGLFKKGRESDLPAEDEKVDLIKNENPFVFKTEKEKLDEDKKVDEDTEVKPEDVARG